MCGYIAIGLVIVSYSLNYFNFQLKKKTNDWEILWKITHWNLSQPNKSFSIHLDSLKAVKNAKVCICLDESWHMIGNESSASCMSSYCILWYGPLASLHTAFVLNEFDHHVTPCQMFVPDREKPSSHILWIRMFSNGINLYTCVMFFAITKLMSRNYMIFHKETEKFSTAALFFFEKFGKARQ